MSKEGEASERDPLNPERFDNENSCKVLDTWCFSSGVLEWNWMSHSPSRAKLRYGNRKDQSILRVSSLFKAVD